MMEVPMFGQKIHYFRKLKGLTQEQLAHGICSVSHLSKIENGHETPSPHMLDHLCKRLNISPTEIDSQGDIETITQKLQEWYIFLGNRDLKEAAHRYPLLKEQIYQIQDPNLLLKFKIFTLHYQLLLRDIKSARRIVKEIEPFEKKLNSDLKYYYYLFYGFYSFLNENYFEALKLYKLAEKIRDEQFIQEPEVYYYLSLINMQLHRTFQSFKYAEMSLNIFQRDCNYIRSIDCQILLGVNMTRTHQYDQAEKYLSNALQMAEKLSNCELMSYSYHNLGYMYLSQGNYQKAIHNFLKSSECWEEEHYEKKVRTYYCLAKAYIELHDYPKAMKWIDRGVTTAKQNNLKEFVLHFKYLTFKIYPTHHIQLETLLKNELIPYFEAKKDWYNVANYAEVLAEYYSKKFKYKDSSYYYFLVNESRKKMYSEES